MAQSVVLVMMMLMALVLAYWYYLQKTRTMQANKKFDLPVDRIALHSINEAEKKECVPRTDETQASLDDVTEAENISEGRGAEISKVDPVKKIKTSGMDSAESIDNLDPQIAQKYAFLREGAGKVVDLEAFDEPISEEEMAIYRTPSSIREKQRTKKKKNASPKKVKATKSKDKSAKNGESSKPSSKKSSRSSRRKRKGPFKNKRLKFAKHSGDSESTVSPAWTTLDGASPRCPQSWASGKARASRILRSTNGSYCPKWENTTHWWVALS